MDLPAQSHSGENRGLNIDHQVSSGDGAEGLRGTLKGRVVLFVFWLFLLSSCVDITPLHFIFTVNLASGLIEWMNKQLPNLNLPAETSLETFRACLLGGPTLGHLLNSLSPGAVEMVGSSFHVLFCTFCWGDNLLLCLIVVHMWGPNFCPPLFLFLFWFATFFRKLFFGSGSSFGVSSSDCWKVLVNCG